MSKVQRKQGVGGLFRPVSWNKGRRFTSPGPEIQKLNGNSGIQNYEGPLMRLQIEAYLDDNPEFAESYVLRKISRKTIEKWLKLHSVQEQENPLLIVQEPTTPGRKFSDEPSYSSQIRKRFSADNSPTIRRSISVTPNRKISASVFEASGLRSAILSTADDGSASFLSTNSAVDLSRQRSKSLILVGEQRSIKDVTNTIISELDLSVLCQKIAHHLLSISQGSECTIALPTDGLKRGYRIEAINIRQNGVGGVRQISALPLPDSRVEIDNSTVSLLTDGRLVYLPSSSNLFPKTSQVTLPGAAGGICLIPLRDIQEELQGFAAVKGRDLLELQANTVLLDLARISGICLKNSTQYNAARLEVTRSQVFLDLARVIFDEQTSIEFTVLKILINFLSLIECERAQVLLSSAESPTQFHKVFDLEEADLNRPDFEELKSPFENRFPINSSISGLVAATGETVNIGDLSTDHRFDPRLNGDVDVEHRSLLCMPILDSDQKILGVISLINKKEGQFTWNDERFVEAFGIFCGIALRNVSQFEIVQSAEARCQVALEIMSYHADSDPKEAEELSKLPVPSVLSLQLQSLTFLDTELQERDTVRACLRMFYELDLVSRFGLDHNVLCRWLLTTKKNYRVEVLYHNWNHAFNVAQMMFSCLLNSGWWSGLGPISCLGLLIACLSHDLDHRGTNNSYQLSTDSPLARLYSTSTLERHHLNQTLVILNLQDNRILEPLNSTEYTAVLTIVEEAIIATDLALHFAHLSKLTALSNMGPQGVNWEDGKVTSIIRSALMTAADLGASTKPWEMQKEVAGLIAEEFWQQGDLERVRLNKPSQPLMDRDLRDSFPQLQVGFCQDVCLPVYKSLTNLCPALHPLQDGVEDNRDRWLEIARNQDRDEEEGDEEDEEEEEREIEERSSDEEKTIGTDNQKVTRNL